MKQVKGFMLYVAIVATVVLVVFITWLKKEDPTDERIGYESGRYERD